MVSIKPVLKGQVVMAAHRIEVMGMPYYTVDSKALVHTEAEAAATIAVRMEPELTEKNWSSQPLALYSSYQVRDRIASASFLQLAAAGSAAYPFSFAPSEVRTLFSSASRLA